MEKRKEKALKTTLDSTNFMIRGMAESRLKGAPYMCRAYNFESLPNVLRVTCDDRPIIDIRLDGKPTHYPTKKDGGFSSVAKVTPKRIVQSFELSKVEASLQDDQSLIVQQSVENELMKTDGCIYLYFDFERNSVFVDFV